MFWDPYNPKNSILNKKKFFIFQCKFSDGVNLDSSDSSSRAMLDTFSSYSSRPKFCGMIIFIEINTAKHSKCLENKKKKSEIWRGN